MKRGVTAGFGYPIGADVLAQIKAHGYELVRQGNQHGDASVLLPLIDEIQAAGLTPVILCTVAQLAFIPPGLDVEVLDAPDPTSQGLEPSFRVLAADYAAALNRGAAVVRARRLKAWACLTGLDGVALAWTSSVLKTLDPIYGISVHRYPPGNAFSVMDSTSGSRSEEFANLKTVIGSRPWMVGEFGWDQGPRHHWYDYLLLRHTHLTDAQLDGLVASEWNIWQAAGAQFACVYQLNDEPARCARHPYYAATGRGGYGRRRPEGTWK